MMPERLINLLRDCTVHVHGAMPGAGFFVAPNIVVTCAHVVGTDAVPGSKVKLSLASADQGLAADGEVPEAIVRVILPHQDEDLAVLSLTEAIDHPCVLLGSKVQYGDPLYVWGFPDYNDSRGARLDGLAGSFVSYTELPSDGVRRRFLKFSGDRVVPGFSGGPLLDLRTGTVTGIVTETLDGRLPLGGWAVPVDLIEEHFPEIIEAHRAYHAEHAEWSELLAAERRIPWAEETLPENFVARRELLSDVVRALVDSSGQPTQATVSIVGFGGFGKTVLARAALKDPRVRNAYGLRGAVWVTLGQKPSETAAMAADLVELLTHKRPGFVSTDAALQRLQEVFDEYQPLVVVDDVWKAVDARPLLGAARNCSRIVTTRHVSEAPDGLTVNADDGMSTAESILLLSYGLSLSGDEEALAISSLAEQLRHWPILLSLANAALRFAVAMRRRQLKDAVTEAHSRFKKRGLTAFDPKDARQRTEAVALTVAASLELLEAEMRPRFRDLAVFPEDAAIPFGVLRRLWNATGNLDSDEAADLLSRLIQLSLLTPVFPDREGSEEYVQLHDVLRAHVLGQTTGEELASLHGKLLDSVALPWSRLPFTERYLWEWLGWHLIEADRGDTLAALLVDFDWIERRVAAGGVSGLLGEYRRLQPIAGPSTAERAIRLFAHALAIDTSQFALQLALRLRDASIPSIVALRDRAREAAARLPIVVEGASLAVPGPLMQTLVGHGSAVSCVALSRGGRRALSGGLDGTVRLWDLGSGACLDVFESGSYHVHWVGFFDNERCVASVTSDSRIRAWEVATRRVLIDEEGGRSFADAALDAKRERLFVASWHDQVDAWDLRSFERLEPLHGVEEAAVCILAGADGAVFAGDAKGFLRRWRFPDPSPIWSEKVCEARVTAIALSPDGSRLASVASDGTLAIVNAVTGALEGKEKAHGKYARDVCWTLSGRGLASCSQAGDVAFFDEDLQSVVDRHELGVQSVNVLAATLDGSRVLSGDTSGAIHLWDAENGERLRTLTGHTYGIWAIAVSSDGARAISASGDFTLRTWDLHTDEPPGSIDGHGAPVSGLVLQRSGFALSGGENGTMRLSHEALSSHHLYDFGAGIVHCACQPDGPLVAFGLADGSLALWDDSKGITRRWDAHPGRIERIIWSADGSKLASAHERIARLWDVDGSGVEEVSFEQADGSAAALGFVEGNLAVIAANRHGGLRVYLSDDPFDDGEPFPLPLDEYILHLTPSPDGRWVLSEARDGPMRLWDISSRTAVTVLDRLSRSSNFHRVSRGGEFVTIGSYEGDFSVWRAGAGAMPVTLVGNAGPATDAQVTANGKFLVTQSAWAVGIWDLQARRRLASFTADGAFTRIAVEDRGTTLRIVAGDALGRVHWVTVNIA